MPFPLPKRREARIDLSPLIDVVFQLLIFFVITTTFLTDTGIPLDLPEAESGEQRSTAEDLSIRVSADGGIRFRGVIVSLADLERQIQDAVAESPTGVVTIYGDRHVDYETIIQVIDLARRAEAKGVVLPTEEPREGARVE